MGLWGIIVLPRRHASCDCRRQGIGVAIFIFGVVAVVVALSTLIDIGRLERFRRCLFLPRRNVGGRPLRRGQGRPDKEPDPPAAAGPLLFLWGPLLTIILDLAILSRRIAIAGRRWVADLCELLRGRERRYKEEPWSDPQPPSLFVFFSNEKPSSRASSPAD